MLSRLWRNFWVLFDLILRFTALLTSRGGREQPHDIRNLKAVLLSYEIGHYPLVFIKPLWNQTKKPQSQHVFSASDCMSRGDQCGCPRHRLPRDWSKWRNISLWRCRKNLMGSFTAMTATSTGTRGTVEYGGVWWMSLVAGHPASTCFFTWPCQLSKPIPSGNLT